MYCTRCKKEHFETSKMCSNCKEQGKKQSRKYRELRVEEYNEKQCIYRKNNKDKFISYKNTRKNNINYTVWLKIYKETRTRKLSNIKHSAKNRNIPFDLEDDYSMALTDKPCFYCGTATTTDKRNGIDRLDNTVGYTVSNCASCCGICNFMKKCLDALTFVERCSQVSLHNGHSGKVCDFWDDIKGQTFNEYKHMMKHKDFQLTEEQYYNLLGGDCKYCGRPCTETHTNGIDRVDNDIGYVLDNCVSCCGSCNIAKGVLSVEDFVSKCVLIASRERTIPDMPRSIQIFVRNRPNQNCD